ncbi:MAG: DUF6261 family protein, partial [Bacteroidales bacterium]
MTCKRLHLEGLRNEECFQYLTEVRDLTQKYGAEALDLEAIFEKFLSLYQDFDVALEKIRKSSYTQQIADADAQRDTLFRGFVDTIKSAHNHFNTNYRESARKLQIALDHYGNIAQKSYDEQTAAV